MILLITLIPLNLDIALRGLRALKVLNTLKKPKLVPELLAVNPRLIMETLGFF